MKSYTKEELKTMFDTIELNSFEELNSITDYVKKECGGLYGAIEHLKTGHYAINKGYFCIKDYDISSIFTIIDNIITLDVMCNVDGFVSPFFKIKIDLRNQRILSKTCSLDTHRKNLLLSVEKEDETCLKQYRCILEVLCYMSMYKVEPIEVENKISKSDKKKIENKFMYRKVPLVTKKYVVSVNHHGKHNITCPAWTVRGYYRHYKSGKVIWIDGYTKGKDRDKIAPKTKLYSGI